MLKTTICFLIGMCTLMAAHAQQGSSMKERMIEHLKKEKFRTPVPVEDAIASFEARYFDKKTRSSQELKVSNSSSPAVEEGEAHIAMDPNNNNRMVLSYMATMVAKTGTSATLMHSLICCKILALEHLWPEAAIRFLRTTKMANSGFHGFI